MRSLIVLLVISSADADEGFFDKEIAEQKAEMEARKPPAEDSPQFLSLAYSLSVCSTEDLIRRSQRYSAALKNGARATIRRQIALEDQEGGRRGLKAQAREVRKQAAKLKIKLLKCGSKEVQRFLPCVRNDREECDGQDFDSALVSKARGISDEIWQSEDE